MYSWAKPKYSLLGEYEKEVDASEPTIVDRARHDFRLSNTRAIVVAAILVSISFASGLLLATNLPNRCIRLEAIKCRM